LHSHLFRIKPHVQALVARNDHHPLFFKLSVNVFIFNKISLLSHLFFIMLQLILLYNIILLIKQDNIFKLRQVWTQKMCCPKGKCGCQYFILLTLKKKSLYQEFPIGWAEIFRSPPWLNLLFINLLLMIQCYIPWEGEGGYDENLK
jgi:hypothetical protein